VTETWNAIRQKRMVRRFEARPLEPEHLTRIVDAGRHSASSKNQQHWDFVVVEDRTQLEALAKCGDYAGHLAGAAAAVALVTPHPKRPGASLSVIWDVGMAAENMMLAAWELGIGSCPATVYDQDVARGVLRFPADRFCGWILSFGYPADPEDMTRPPRRGGRKSLDEVVHRGTW
jgi:nitroreductase